MSSTSSTVNVLTATALPREASIFLTQGTYHVTNDLSTSLAPGTYKSHIIKKYGLAALDFGLFFKDLVQACIRSRFGLIL